MMRRLYRTCALLRARALLLALFAVTGPAVAGERLDVAADTALQPALTDIAALYARKTGNRLAVTHEASGVLADLIDNGRAFDLLLTADQDTASQLVAAGLSADEPRLFAWSRLMVVTTRGLPIADWQQWIRSGRVVTRIALADPARSPHGRETEKALAALGLQERVRDRLAPMPNAAAAVNEVVEGRAEIAFAPISLLHNPADNIQIAELPPKSYRPLAHTLLVTPRGARRVPATVREFADFLFTPEARDILRRYGYTLP